MNSSGDLYYWKIQSNNTGAISLNLTGDDSELLTYNQGLMSPDQQMLLLVVGRYKTEVWDMET